MSEGERERDKGGETDMGAGRARDADDGYAGSAWGGGEGVDDIGGEGEGGCGPATDVQATTSRDGSSNLLTQSERCRFRAASPRRPRELRHGGQRL
jgi:hypothetical protein